MNLGLGFIYAALLLSVFLTVLWLLNFVDSIRRDQRRKLIENYIGDKISKLSSQSDQPLTLTQRIVDLTPKTIVDDLRSELESAGYRSATTLNNVILARHRQIKRTDKNNVK